jgi:hypothetical protein
MEWRGLSCYHPPLFAAQPASHRTMEINQVRRSLDDLTERSEALRRFL